MSDAYFSNHNYISNSVLKDLRKLLYGGFEMEQDKLQKIFDFGSLIDAHLTEKASILKFEALVDESEHEKALLMVKAGENDPTLKLLIAACKTQHEIYRKAFKFEWEGWQLQLPVRIKLDFLKKFVLAGDLKSTATQTQKGFLEAIDFFDYDQQAALYMDVAEVDKFMFVGISKKPNKKGKFEVFKHAVERGDAMYLSGKKKYSFLMYKYYFLIHHLNFEPCESSLGF
jgi:hypothetical protein